MKELQTYREDIYFTILLALKYLICEGHSWTTILAHTLRLLFLTTDSTTASYLQLSSQFCEKYNSDHS